MTPALRTTPRWPAVEPDAGHYESFYLKLAHPTEPRAVWIRHTVHKRPEEEPLGSVWFTLWDDAPPVASKVTPPPAELGTGDDHYISVGESRLEDGRATGAARTEQLDASWDLTWEGEEGPFHHLPRDWMYGAPLPKTKLLSPYPAVSYSGTIRVGEREVVVDGWPGMVGHNWGAQHAERWIWLHGTRFEGQEDAWFDGALGRIKIGSLTTPWIGNGVLTVGGRRYRLGGPGRVRRTKVSERPEGARFTLPGRELTVRGEISAPRDRLVGWVYADPDGSEHNTVHSSVAALTLVVTRRGAPDVTLRTAGGATYELGMRETDHGIALQPFPDGAPS